MLSQRGRKMRNTEVPDADQRAELVWKVETLIHLYREGIGGAYAQGGKLDQFRPEQLSNEAKRILPEDLDESTAHRIAQYQGPKFVKWLKDPDTEGSPIPQEFTEIMRLIDLL